MGLDVRAGLGSSLTLNATINPDFGQVELDPAVVNLTDVESTFEEKRPFFTEGVSIYSFGRGGTNNNVHSNWPTQIFFTAEELEELRKAACRIMIMPTNPMEHIF